MKIDTDSFIRSIGLQAEVEMKKSMKTLLEKEDRETQNETENIASNWPKDGYK